MLHQKMINDGLWNDNWKNEYTLNDRLSVDLKIAIFVDGDYWHANPKKYLSEDILYKTTTASMIWKKDKWVNRLVEKKGWTVLRFWESEIKKNIQICIKKITENITKKMNVKEISNVNFDIIQDYKTMQALIIDAHHLLSRTFHVPALQHLKSTVDGVTTYTGATYGFLNSFKSIVEAQRHDALIVVWDGGGKGFRNQIYPEYKANRIHRTDEFIYQLKLTQEFLKLMGVRQEQVPNVEADDIIGVLSKQARKFGWKVLIISGDKDFNQLVSNNVFILNPRQGEDGTDRIMTPEKVKEIYGVTPNQFIDWLTLNGDSSDNVDGIDGIGKKTASELIQANNSIQEIINSDIHYKLVNGVKKPVSKKLQDKLNANKEKLKLNLQLVKIQTDLDVKLNKNKPDPDFIKLKDMFKTYEFNSFIRDFNKFVMTFS
jgi:DNA polymerase I